MCATTTVDLGGLLTCNCAGCGKTLLGKTHESWYTHDINEAFKERYNIPELTAGYVPVTLVDAGGNPHTHHRPACADCLDAKVDWNDLTDPNARAAVACDGLFNKSTGGGWRIDRKKNRREKGLSGVDSLRDAG